MKKRYVVRELPPYQSDPKVIEHMLLRAVRSGWMLEWVIPVGGRGMKWAGVFRRCRGGDDVWQYRVIQFPRYCSDISVVEGDLNRLAEEGWELVDILKMGRTGQYVVGIFRRPWRGEEEKEGGEAAGRRGVAGQAGSGAGAAAPAEGA